MFPCFSTCSRTNYGKSPFSFGFWNGSSKQIFIIIMWLPFFDLEMSVPKRVVKSGLWLMTINFVLANQLSLFNLGAEAPQQIVKFYISIWEWKFQKKMKVANHNLWHNCMATIVQVHGSILPMDDYSYTNVRLLLSYMFLCSGALRTDYFP